jgi:hypothetical protein
MATARPRFHVHIGSLVDFFDVLDIPFDSILDEFRCIVQFEFLLQVGFVGFNRLYTEVQLLRDCLCLVAVADELEYLEFAVAQLFKSGKPPFSCSPLPFGA